MLDVLRLVGIPSAAQRVQDYPHQFSGGMAQRVMIGTAISCTPSLLIADEPTTALDVTIQAQILYLMRRLAAETQAAVLLVSHDLGMISQMCHRVIVMYAGTIVEEASVDTTFQTTAHPYTQGLIASIPRLHTAQERLGAIPGTMPGLRDIPSGCRFHPRCQIMEARCQVEPPPFYLAQLERHLIPERSRGDHVPGSHRRDRSDTVGISPAFASVHTGAIIRDSNDW